MQDSVKMAFAITGGGFTMSFPLQILSASPPYGMLGGGKEGVRGDFPRQLLESATHPDCYLL